MEHKFAAQLYTLREQCEQDFPGVLRDLKQMGWQAVQISGLRGFSAEEISQVLKETGLRTAGIHIPLEMINNQLPEVLRQAELFGTKDLVVPFLPETLRSELGYRLVKSNLADIAKKLKRHGYTLSYHNHAFEFETMVEGLDALHYITDPSGDHDILAEIDVYWIKKGGRDPLAYISKYSNRMPIIHLKDMTDDEEQAYAELGSGSIDFLPILRWGEANGVEWYAVEQDICKRPPMECLQTSLDHLYRLANQLRSEGRT